jgi:hypothetical protein
MHPLKCALEQFFRSLFLLLAHTEFFSQSLVQWLSQSYGSLPMKALYLLKKEKSIPDETKGSTGDKDSQNTGPLFPGIHLSNSHY